MAVTAPDGARSDRVKETASHRRMRRARSEARTTRRLVQACSMLQGHHGSAVPRIFRSFQRVFMASADAETQCGADVIVTCEVAVQCDVGVGTVDAEVKWETHGENSETQKVKLATQCDFDSHEDYNLVGGQMALPTGLVGKKQLNGKLGWLEWPVDSSRQRWSVIVAEEDTVVSIATKNLVRVPPSEIGHAVTSLMAQMDHGVVQRFPALVDTPGVVSMESESGTESESVRSREAPSSPHRSKRRQRRLYSVGTRTDSTTEGHCPSDAVSMWTAGVIMLGGGMGPSMVGLVTGERSSSKAKA